MKLVEILAREWSGWPVSDNLPISQDVAGCLYVSSVFTPSETTMRLDEEAEIADDMDTAEVTRHQWQAERERIASECRVKMTDTEQDIEFIMSPFYQEMVLDHKLMQERRKDEAQYVEGVKRIQDEAFDAALKELEQKILAVSDQPTYEQQLWDKVAFMALSKAIGEIEVLEDAVFGACGIAEAFMAERAKRLKK